MEFTLKDIFKKYLMPYQYSWVMDESRFKMGMWSRQTGKSFATAAEAFSDSVATPGTTWVVISAGERQALEWMEKAKFWVKVMRTAVEFAEPEFSEAINLTNPKLTKAEIRFANGSRIVAIPANPDTARGYSGNIVLDEFAIHEDPTAIWGATYPYITNPLDGIEKKLRVVSTPKGLGNKFADLWTHNAVYSTHKVTIEDAVRMGLPVDIEELRLGLDDEDLWRQEYMCEFIDSSAVLLPYDMINACESAEIEVPDDAPRYIGMDVGRRRDLSAIIELAEVGDVLYLTDIEVLENTPYREQLENIVTRAGNPRVRRVAIDATGIGDMLAEEARRIVGGKVKPVVFNVATKVDMYGRLRRRFEERTIRLPINRELREDLHSVQKIVTCGRVTYSAPRNADGHSDRASGLALAVSAASRRGEFFAPAVLRRTGDYDTRAI